MAETKPNNTIDIEALASGQFENAKVRIVLPDGAGGGVVSGFTQDPFSIAGAASFEGKQVGHFDQFDGLLNAGAMLANSMGADIANFTTLSRPATNRRWTSSDPVQFPVNFMLVAYKDGIDVRQDAAKLFRCVYPAGGAIGWNIAMTAPMDYAYEIDKHNGNTITLQIGKWFQADGLLMDDVQVTFSREVVQNGSPLYAEISLTLSPWRMVYADDIAGYITGG